MELQIALDRIPLEHAIGITRDVAGTADWVEVGTSLVKQYGMAGVADVVAAAGATPVLADLKTVDDVEFELSLAYDAGARSATVLGLAPWVSVDTAVRVASDRGQELVVDLMGLTSEQVTGLAGRLPAEVVLAAHVSKDMQAGGVRPDELLGPWAEGRRLALAGGLTAEDLTRLRDVPDLRVVVGSAVTKAADPTAAVQELLRAAGRE
jgi:3-hexulose-6-phosphate synthase